MASLKIIGSIDTNAGTFMFGQTNEGVDCYKNAIEFGESSDEICYIPTNGAGSEDYLGVYRLDDATTYTYKDFEKLIQDFLKEHYPAQVNDLLLVLDWENRLFDACQGDDPSTIIDGWVRDIDDDKLEMSHKCMIHYISNFDWNQNTDLLEQVYKMLP